MYSLFYAAELSGIGYAPNSGAKVQKNSEICKYICNLQENVAKIQEKNEKNAVVGCEL